MSQDGKDEVEVEVKERYERPEIARHVTGLMNKFGAPASRKPMTHIAGVPVSELVAAHGSPLFVFSEADLARKYRDASRAFTTRHPHVELAWSYKTNYLDAICAILHREGAAAEVVSELEYEKARRLGVPGNKIYFNGPYKPVPALERAARDGAKIHVDHLDEVHELEGIASRLDKKPEIAIRINLDAGIQPQWGRFGFNLESGQALAAVRRIVGGGKLNLVGLHCHIGTFILEPDAYRVTALKLGSFALQIEKEYGVKIEYLDMGGGFTSTNTLKGQYFTGESVNPDFDRYAEAVSVGLAQSGLPAEDPPRLVLETGRAIVDESGYLVSTVIANKRLPNGLRAIILDAGVNTLFTSFWYNHQVIPAQEHDPFNEPAAVYGPLCMNIDIIRPEINLPSLSTGDRVVIRPVGAYNVTQWMQFIRSRPPVVLIGLGGEVELIREAEDLSDILRREKLPPRLSLEGQYHGGT
ncbi:MAG: diaminopimelate decarboxylase [Deltaproteobacteria bacterium]|nr:diaminopimelate decarboxylase [Deltaproteobacteria bacterium]